MQHTQKLSVFMQPEADYMNAEEGVGGNIIIGDRKRLIPTNNNRS